MRATRLLIAIGVLLGTGGPAPAVVEPDELIHGTFATIRKDVLHYASLQGAFRLPALENNPTVSGATLRLLDTGGGEDILIDLPAEGWKRLPLFRPNLPLIGYRYKGAGTPDDPCTLVAVRPRVVKAICRGIGFTLPVNGTLGIVISIAGDMKRYCAEFGGITEKNTAIAFWRHDAPAPSACPAPGATTTSSTLVETTTSTSSTVEEGSTTSSSTSSTTSSTVEDGSTTTSSTTVEASTTSTSTLEDGSTTTTSSTVVEASTTSTSTLEEGSTTTTSSTVIEASTTSTSTIEEGSTTSSSTSSTSTSSTTSTTVASCCNGDSFLSFATINAPGDCGDILRANGNLFAELACAGLYTGAGGNSVPLPLGVPDLGLAVTSIASCTGQMATIGPATSAQTGSVLNCSAPGCFFGAPLAVPNPGTPPTSVCVLNQVAEAPSGSVNCGTGATSVDLPLTSILFLTGDTSTDPGDSIPGVQPCPLCSDGTCIGGPNDGMGCTEGTTAVNAAYPTSHDCPPDPMFNIGSLPIGLSLTTGTVTWTAVPSGNQTRVFSGFCRDADGTGAFQEPANQCLENGVAVGGGCSGTFEACVQRSQGAFGPNGGAVNTITAIGSASSLLGGAAPGTLVSVFSIPPTFDATVDAAGDLPGPGAVAIPGTAQTCPVANPCP